MEQLGFNLPDVIRNTGLQKNRLRADIEMIEQMIHEYNMIINKLDKPEVCDVFNRDTSLIISQTLFIKY